MIKDNIIALLYHILLIIISTIYLILIVVLGPYIGDAITNPVVRIILAIIWAGSYVAIGTRLDIRHKSKYDFSMGLIIGFIGLILWAYSLIKTGFTLDVSDDNLIIHLIPLNIYINPMYQISFLLDIKFNQLVRLIACFIPTLLIGIGITIKRARYLSKRHKTVN
jgi:hypothetical protein